MPNTYRTTSPTDSGSMNYHIADYALAEGLDRLNSDLVVTRLVTNYSREARDQGSRFGENVRVPFRGETGATDKVPGTAKNPAAVTSTKTDLPINQHKTWDILVEDYGALFASEGLLTGYLRDGASEIAETVEAAILALYTEAGETLGTAGGGADEELVRLIRKTSRANKWRMSRPSYAIWGAKGESDLLAEELFVKANESGSTEALVNARLGRKFGIEHYSSNLVPYVTNSPDLEIGLAFQSEGIGVAFVDMSFSDMPEEFQGAGVFMRSMFLSDDAGIPTYSMRAIVGYDQRERGNMLTVDSIFGVKVIRDSLVFRIDV